MIKKIFLLSIFAVFTFCGCSKNNDENDLYKSIARKNNIVVGISFDSKPFGFRDLDGKVKGMEADMAKEISKRILGDENKVIFKDVTAQDRINAVESGNADMVISTMTITPQRKKLVYFSNPYFVTGQTICVRRGRQIDSVGDLLNKRIIVILGTTGERNIRRFAPNALIQGYISNSEAIKAFRNDEGDAITTDDSLLQGLVIENNDFMILPNKLTKENYGIAFKKAKQTRTFKQRVNEIISEMNADGTLQSLKNKWGIN